MDGEIMRNLITGKLMRNLPITLPSLETAVVRVPVPMSPEDFDWLMGRLNEMRKNLVAGCEVPPPMWPAPPLRGGDATGEG